MNLFEFIKKKLGINKPKTLNPGRNTSVQKENIFHNYSEGYADSKIFQNEKNEQKRKDFRESIKITTSNLISSSEPSEQLYFTEGSLDYAIDQYIKSVLVNYEKNQVISSYNSLISLSALDNSYKGNNQTNQEVFLENLNDKKYSDKIALHVQKDRNGKPCFFHVSTKGFPGDPTTRLYLNCERKNVALLADALSSELGDSDYYYKFGADEQTGTRSEKFVFYVNEKGSSDELSTIINALEQIKQKNPELLEDSEHINPFMKDINGFIAYAPDVSTSFYKNLSGNITPIAESYNSLLAEALNDSFLNSLQNISITEHDLALKASGQTFGDVSAYLTTGICQSINEKPTYLKKLINSMKNNLTIASRNNPELDIKGISRNNLYNKNYAFER